MGNEMTPVALVTGGSRGLGLRIARRLTEDGFTVAICGRFYAAVSRAARVIGECGLEPTMLVGDITADSDALVAEVMRRQGRLDVLVNNAAVFGPLTDFTVATRDAWEMPIRVNLLGTAAVCRAAIPAMSDCWCTDGARVPRIINILGGGLADPEPALSSYAISKAGVARLTEELAAAEPWLCVNGVLPGPLPTRFTDRVVAAGPDAVGERLYEDVLCRETGDAEFEPALELVSWLASQESNGVSGRILSARHDDWMDLSGAPDAYRMRRVDSFTVNRNAALASEE